MELLEKYAKVSKNWKFIGYSNLYADDEFLIKERETKDYIFKTYKWLTGEEETFRFRKNGDINGK